MKNKGNDGMEGFYCENPLAKKCEGCVWLERICDDSTCNFMFCSYCYNTGKKRNTEPGKESCTHYNDSKEDKRRMSENRKRLPTFVTKKMNAQK